MTHGELDRAGKDLLLHSYTIGQTPFLARLQQTCDMAPQSQESLFPRARLALTGTIERLLQRSSALEVEDMFKYQLAETRKVDAVTGGASTGPHKTDLRTSL